MSEVATQPATGSEEQGSVPAESGTSEPAQTPSGFVPASEAETAREEARRARQAAEDLRRELAQARTAKPEAPAANEASGFDPDDFRRSLLRDVTGAMNLATQASTIKSEFPQADPSLFEPGKLSEFSSIEAFRLAAQDSHQRVAAILDAGWAAKEAALREELTAKFGDGGAATGTAPAVTGDPTPERLAAMTMEEVNALPEGTFERVMRNMGQ